MEIAAKVRAVIAELSGTDDFADDTPLGGAPFEQRGLCLESLDRIELVIQLEEAFNIDIPDDDFTSDAMGTPGGIVTYIEGRLGVNGRYIVGRTAMGWLYSDTPDGSSLPGISP